MDEYVQTALMAAVILTSGMLVAARAADVTTPSRIDRVTVYPRGADIARLAHVSLAAGEQSVLINDLPAGALPQSIRVEGRSTGTSLQIGSVDTRRVSVPRADSVAVAGQRRALEDRIEALKDQKLVLQADVQAAEAQKALIAELIKLPSRPVMGPAAGPEPDWMRLLDLVADRTAAAQRRILDITIKIRDLDRQLTEASKTLTTLAPAPEARTEVKVFVAATAATEADLVVRYQVGNAGWTPFYDARLATGGKGQAAKLQLIRRASIEQHSGEAWDDVALTLSTTRPAAATAAPDLGQQSVDFQLDPPPMAQPMPAPAAPMALGAARAKSAAATIAMDEPQDALKKVDAQDVAAVADLQGFQALYAIPGKVSVASTGELKRVQISAEDFEPTLVARTVPRLDPLAYLYAKLSLPKTSGPVLAGAVSLFRDGTFVGQGRVPQLAAGEDHELGFGADDQIKVRRAVIEDKAGQTGVFTTTRAEDRNYTITVKNLHANPVLVQVIDRIPVSAQQDIKVDATYKPLPSRRDLTDHRGTFAWDITLAPDQETVLAFGYKVSAPAGKPIVYNEQPARFGSTSQ